jgi:hypothetical protein
MILQELSVARINEKGDPTSRPYDFWDMADAKIHARNFEI